MTGPGAAAGDRSSPGQALVTAQRLVEDLASPLPPLVLDVRWRLGDRRGREDYLAGHVPGARFVDLDAELAGPARAGAGRHPLPAPAEFVRTMQRFGVRTGIPVVVYDDSGSPAAARAWWMLRAAGHEEVALLDGGLAAWRAAGGSLEVGSPAPIPPAPAQVASADPPEEPDDSWWGLPVLSPAAAAEVARLGVLLDARGRERYSGVDEPVDRRGGHIPGALSVPVAATLDAQGHFRDADTLRAHFAALGVGPGRPLGVYCGSGVTAAQEILALHLAGLEAALFPGSWSQWIDDPGRPVATGDAPG